MSGDEKCREEDDDEVNNQRRRDTHDGHDLVNHLMALRGKENENRV